MEVPARAPQGKGSTHQQVGGRGLLLMSVVVLRGSSHDALWLFLCCFLPWCQHSMPSLLSYMPLPMQNLWRRRVTSSSWMFTPHTTDLSGDAVIPVGADTTELSEMWGPCSGWQQQQCHLALALYWARWQLGEPITVRGVTVRIMARAGAASQQH